MPADPAAPVTEPRHSCGPRAELIETAAYELHRSESLGKRRSDMTTAVERATYRRIACDVLTETLPALTLADLPAALLDEHEQQIRAKVAGEFTDLIAGAEPVICADEDDPVAPPVLAVAVVDVQRILAARGTEGGTR